MVQFKYVTPQELLLDSFRLGKKIYESGFIPNHAVSLWRGGTPVGLGVGEYFRLKGHFINHTTVATASYTGVNSQSDVLIKGLEHLTKVIAREDKLLIIDDIYDSGNTIEKMIQTIRKTARFNAPDQILVACIDKKKRLHPFNHQLIYINEVEEPVWLSYPHEIADLVQPADSEDSFIRHKSEAIHQILNQEPPLDITEVQSDKPYIYLDPEELLLDSFRLASRIYSSGYRPDYIIAIWPGGINVGLPLHEFYKYRYRKENQPFKNPDHISINTSMTHLSYKSNIIGIRYLEENINPDSKILLVETVYSTGRLINQTIDKLLEILRRNIQLDNIKVASLYYYPVENVTWNTHQTVQKPHYYLKLAHKEVIFPHNIHRLPHPEKDLAHHNPDLKQILYH